MKKNNLTNTLLGVIAINLTLITLIQLDIFPPKTYANSSDFNIENQKNYTLVPLNENGSIDVNLTEGSSIFIEGYINGMTGEKEKLFPMKKGAGIPVFVTK